MKIFDRDLDIESIELSFIEPEGSPRFGVGVLDDSDEPTYNKKMKVLRFTLIIEDEGPVYRYEYIIQEKNGGYRYREIDSIEIGEAPNEGPLTLFDGESEIILHYSDDDGNRYYFHIARIA